MHCRTAISGLAGLILSAGAATAEVTLTAAEITALLSGRTAIGEWNGRPYRQYFDSDGATIYAERDARSALGYWRTDPDTAEYQSWWRGSGWESWQIIRRDGMHFWVNQDGAALAFDIVDGQQLNWPPE